METYNDATDLIAWKNGSEGVLNVSPTKRLAYRYQHAQIRIFNDDKTAADSQNEANEFAENFCNTIGQQLTMRQTLALSYVLTKDTLGDHPDKNEKIDQLIAKLLTLKN